LSPTEAGTIYFDRIEPLVEEMQQAIDITTDVSGRTIISSAIAGMGLDPTIGQSATGLPLLNIYFLNPMQ
jgi:DNA-binding transcriptional LysR family regulator